MRCTKMPGVWMSVRIELAGLDELLDFGDRHLPAVAIIGLKFRAVFR